MKGSWRAAEDWHCVAGLESLKRAQERLPVKVQPSCSKRPKHVWRRQHHGMTTKQQWSGASRSLKDKLVMLQRAESEKWPKPFGGAQKIVSESRMIGHWIFYTVGVWFCFVHIVTVPWFFSLEGRKYLICFWFYRSSQLWDFQVLKKRFWSFTGLWIVRDQIFLKRQLLKCFNL